jgi:recombination protein RecT
VALEYEVVLADAKIKNAFLQVADEDTYLKEIIFAKQALDNNETLQKCDKNSLRNAIFNIALTGASLNPTLHQAYLVPRKGKVCLDLSYRGLVKIATDSGGVIDVDATVVHDKDDFYYEMGLYPTLKHVPCLDNPGTLKFVYAIATLHNGIKKFIVLSKDEIEKVKATSTAKSGPWSEWYDEMARKTAVKKLYKLLPQTDRMSTAVSVINEHEGLLKDSQVKAQEVMKRFEPVKESLLACPERQSMIPESDCEGCEKIGTCVAKES